MKFQDILSVIETTDFIQVSFSNNIKLCLPKGIECEVYISEIGHCHLSGYDNNGVVTKASSKMFEPKYNVLFPHLSECFLVEKYFNEMLDSPYYDDMTDAEIIENIDIQSILYAYNELGVITIDTDYSDLETLAFECAMKAIKYAENNLYGTYDIPCYFKNGGVIKIGSKGALDYYLITDDKQSLQVFCDKLIEVLERKDVTFTTFECKNDYKETFKIPQTIKVETKHDKFFELQAYLLKYADFNLTKDTLYSVALFGKRGKYNELYEHKKYAYYNNDFCTKVLKWIEKHIPNHPIKVTIVIDEDKSDADYSRYYETECYGSKTTLLKINDHIFWV